MAILIVMTNKDEEIWTDPLVTLQDSIIDYDRKSHGRMTDLIAFELPIDPDILPKLDAIIGQTGGGALPDSAIDSDLLNLIRGSLPIDAKYEMHSANSGRGASGYGVAFEVIQWTSEIGGAGSTIWFVSRGVKKLFDSIANRIGFEPNISLGAAKHLAAADLIDRLNTTEFELYGAGDVCSDPPDRSYTGLDIFWIAFQHRNLLHFYTVTARGKVRHIAKIELEVR